MQNNQLINKIIDCIDNKQSVLITGPAGSGKTYTVKEIFEYYKKQNKNIVLTSTTGITALNIGGITTHKLFGLTNRSDIGYINYMKSNFLFSGIKKRLEKVEIIIIDEISMLRADTFVLINEILKQTCDPNEIFGGKTIIFSGDFFQIPPVIKTWEKEKNQWIFQSDVWKNANIKVFDLKEIFRQKDEEFIELLNNIRIGKWNIDIENKILACEKHDLGPDVTHFFATNDECDNWNKQKISELEGESVIFEATIKGKRNKKYANDKISIKKDCIAKEKLELKINTKVIAIINDKNNRFVNGSIGIVKNMTNIKGKVCVEVLFDGQDKSIVLNRFKWEKLNFNGKVVSSFYQIPLIPSYAITFHKSQGLTLDEAIIDCKNIFTCGQLYVALSRVRTYKKLKVLNFHKSQIIVNENVLDFYSKII